ncbi:hypothetical protein BAUCODRAFT_71110 [Baudoinia panamericana UAMH 10762]|uniref:M-phase inducer phosphatase n=1 Tax=Baudoinia panamericana (strain UAMH 10762) TaxID=717646 RepID=M2MVQ6_BAUPA|nr:uncharacterized protein BAUCODRAFT_71110 [Baudoinia panamericana UAMH 10762]EMC95648.1 hypothetical protein BAUCODRAFT_71110 [Baudoinia panamericana UAMH 10762]
MEYSSPLAALRPQPCPVWANGKDLPMARPAYSGYQAFAPSSFNFKDMSMQPPRPARQDYFTLKPTRGSSPTASLTADLDANFHIDKSPQAPTPRRSLFTTNLFRARDEAGPLSTPPIEIEGARTPPILSSSPGIPDMMDVSPLPHKAPYFVAQVTLPSPSPEETPEETLVSPDLLSPTEIFPAATVPLTQYSTFLALPERTRRQVTRPSLTRTKGYSTNHIPLQPASAEHSLPPFRFGNVTTNALSCTSTPTLAESFTESPVEALTTPPVLPMVPPPRRPSLSSVGRTNGSPGTGHVRKPSGGRPAFVRPQRKIMRRSLSMFQHPDDVMKEEQDSFEPQPNLTSAMDIDQQEPELQLPHHLNSDEPDGLPRISQLTMVDVLEKKYDSHYDLIKVIDCRFEYEYNGGHIDGAVNFNDKQLLTHELFNAPTTDRTLLIFHCEYSVHRAPLTAKFVRSHDRNVNAACYPKLTYPEMYVLDGGYSKFFANHRAKCFPQNYVEMNDQRHEQDCERGMAKVKGRQKLFRAQTFAFGQNAHDGMDASPTASGRSMGARSHSSFAVRADISEGVSQSFSRRMASY